MLLCSAPPSTLCLDQKTPCHFIDRALKIRNICIQSWLIFSVKSGNDVVAHDGKEVEATSVEICWLSTIKVLWFLTGIHTVYYENVVILGGKEVEATNVEICSFNFLSIC